jgi:uncharacterized membrane protein
MRDRYLWKNKKLSKKIVLLKSFPISAQTITESRILLFVINMMVQGALFYAILYFVPSSIHSMLSGAEYIQFALFWYGYSLVCGSLYTYLEVSLQERKYLYVTSSMIFIFLGLPFAFWYFNRHIVFSSIQLVQHYGLLAPLFSLVIGLLAITFFRAKGIKRLQIRDIYV